MCAQRKHSSARASTQSEYSHRCTYEETITKTRLFKYNENFTTKKMKIFR